MAEERFLTAIFVSESLCCSSAVASPECGDCCQLLLKNGFRPCKHQVVGLLDGACIPLWAQCLKPAFRKRPLIASPAGIHSSQCYKLYSFSTMRRSRKRDSSAAQGPTFHAILGKNITYTVFVCPESERRGHDRFYVRANVYRSVQETIFASQT